MNDRLAKFKADVERLRLKTSNARRDTAVQVVGVALMLGGAAATFIAYEVSLSQRDARNIASEQILALGMLALVVIGAALFVFASLAKFLRLWLLRQLYEGQAHVDAVVDALRPRGSQRPAGDG